MKNNHDKILEKIYRYETKKTLVDIFFKIISFIFIIIFFYLFLISLIEILNEQRSFDLLFFFKENLEVFQKYFLENILIFFEEIPKLILLIFILLMILLVKFVFNLKNNLKKIIFKLKSIYKFFKKI